MTIYWAINGRKQIFQRRTIPALFRLHSLACVLPVVHTGWGGETPATHHYCLVLHLLCPSHKKKKKKDYLNPKLMEYSYLLSFLFIPHFKISLVERHGKELSWKWCYPDFFTSDICFRLIGDLYFRECSGLQKTQHFMITESAPNLPIRHLLPHTENKQKSHSRVEIQS